MAAHVSGGTQIDTCLCNLRLTRICPIGTAIAAAISQQLHGTGSGTWSSAARCAEISDGI